MLTSILLSFYSYTIIQSDQTDDKLIKYFIGYGALLGLATFYFYVSFRKLAESNGLFDVIYFIRHLYSPFGKLSNDWSAILLIFLPFNFSFFLNNGNETFKTGYIKMLVVFVNLLAISLSYSRGAYLSLLLYLLILVVFILVFKVKNKKTIFRLYAFIASSVAIIFLLNSKPILEVISPTAKLSQQRSTNGRFQVVKNSLTVIQNNLVTGIGSGNFPLFYSSMLGDKNESSFTTKVGNSYLQLLIEKGIFGMISYLFLIIVIIQMFWEASNAKFISENSQVFGILSFALVPTLLFKELTFSTIFSGNGMFAAVFVLLSIFRSSSEDICVIKLNRKHFLLIVFLPTFLFISTITFLIIRIKTAEHYHTIAVHNYEARNYVEAIKYLDKAIDLSPNQAVYFIHRAVLREKQTTEYNDYSLNDQVIAGLIPEIPIEIRKMIIEDYFHALKLNYTDSRAHHNLGWHFRALGDISNSYKHFKLAVKYDPNETLYKVSLALALDEDCLNKDANKSYRKAITMSPQILNSPLWGMLKKDKSIVEEAMEELQVSKRSDPIANARFAQLNMFIENYSEAFNTLYQLNDKLPNMNRVKYNLGLLFAKKGFHKESLSLMRQSMFLDRQDYLPVLFLARFYEKNRNIKKAIYFYGKALFLQVSSFSSFDKRIGVTYKCNSSIQTLMPEMLWERMRPLYTPATLCSKLARLSSRIGDNERAAKYTQLSKKKTISRFELNVLKN